MQAIHGCLELLEPELLHLEQRRCQIYSTFGGSMSMQIRSNNPILAAVQLSEEVHRPLCVQVPHQLIRGVPIFAYSFGSECEW